MLYTLVNENKNRYRVKTIKEDGIDDDDQKDDDDDNNDGREEIESITNLDPQNSKCQ